MVRMVDVALPGPATCGIWSHDDVRLGPADPARDLAAEIERWLKRAVVIAEKEDILHAQLHRRGALLRMADLGEALRRHRGVAAAAVAVGQDEVGDLPALS